MYVSNYKQTDLLSFNKQNDCSLLSKTNRQFYIRRKREKSKQIQKQKQKDKDKNKQKQKLKEKEQLYKNQHKLQRVLRSLLKKNKNSRDDRARQCKSIEKFNQEQRNKSDRFFEVQDIKKQIQINIKKCNQLFYITMKSFEKCINSESVQQIELNQISFYDSFNRLLQRQLTFERSSNTGVSTTIKQQECKQKILELQNLKLQKYNFLLRNHINNPNSSSMEEKLSHGQINLNSNSRELKQVHYLNINDRRKKQKKHDRKIHTEAEENDGQGSEQHINEKLTLERKMGLKIQQIQIMRKEIVMLKQQIYMLKEDKRSLKQRLYEVKVKNQSLCSEIINLQLKNKKMGISEDKKETVMKMQEEEILSYKLEMFQLKKIYSNLNKKYKSLIIKMKKTTNEVHQQICSYQKHFRIFPEQFEAFEEVRGILHPSNRIHVNKQRKMIDKSLIYQQFLGVKQSVSNKEGVKRLYTAGFQYYYPSFYSLISEDICFFGIDNKNFEHFNPTIKLNFIATMRAILDSKFNEYMFKNKQSNVLSFPSFVLAWLQTYQINDKKSIEKINASNFSTRQTVCTFYVNLMSEKLNHSWEIITFRQFLLETFNKDELYYYLNLRFLFVGGDMTRNLSFYFQQVYYIELNRCFTVMEKILKETDAETKKVFEQFVKMSIVYIRKKSFVDLHYILRVLLELYLSKKNKEIEKLLKTIDIVSQGKKNNINLSQFQKIFDYHFCFLSLTEIIQLFRKCYCIANGSICPDVIITVLNQENIFLRWVDTLMINQEIRLEELSKDQSQQFLITPSIQWILENEKKFRFIHNSQLNRVGNKFGVEQLHKRIKKQANLNSFSIFERLQLSLQICSMTAKKFYFSGLVSNEELRSTIELITQFTDQYSKLSTGRSQILEVLEVIKQKSAGAKIIKFYRKKKAELTRSILYSYSANIVEEQAIQKKEMLRNEFIQIISEAKKGQRVGSRTMIEEII